MEEAPKRINPAVARSVLSWLAAQAGQRMRLEVGTYAPDPPLSCGPPILSIVTVIGRLTAAASDHADAALSLDLPEQNGGNLRIEPSEVVQVTLDGGDGSLRIYNDDETFIAILSPDRWPAPSEGAAAPTSLPPRLPPA